MNPQLVADNLYQLPSCTICLQQLTEDLSSLACGHVFHISCITQHFQYRGSCPNCQKRAMLKEIRLVIFPTIKNNSATANLRKILASFDKSEAEQVQCLLNEIKGLNEKNEKYTNDINQLQKEQKKSQIKLEQLGHEILSIKASQAFLQKQSTALKKQCTRLKTENETIFNENMEFRATCDTQKERIKELQQYRILQKMAQSSSEEMVKYKYELENKQTPPQTMAKQFYEMLQLKNLNILKIKEKQKQAQEKYRIKQEENIRYRDQIKSLKLDIETLTTDKNKMKKKYDELRLKYKELIEKYRSTSSHQNCEIQDEDSFSYSMSMKFGFPKLPQPEKQNNFTVVEKPKIQQKLSFGNVNLKKKANEETKTASKGIKNFMM